MIESSKVAGCHQASSTSEHVEFAFVAEISDQDADESEVYIFLYRVPNFAKEAFARCKHQLFNFSHP